jgi:Putative zinc-finger
VNAPSCRATFPAQSLTAYWLGELDGPAEAEFEEHLFGCDDCTRRLHALAQVGEGVKRLSREGNVQAILPAPFVKRLLELGVRVREYRVQSGGSVMCTITPEDDLVLAHLHAPLNDVRRLDVVLHDKSADARMRIEDVAFDPLADEVVMLPNAVQLRQVAYLTLHVTLLAVDPAGERAIGEYTFNHSPHA